MKRVKKPTAIRSFTDACEVALALHDRSGPAHVAACLDGHGGIVEFSPFDEPGAHVDNAVGWAHCMVSNREHIGSVVFLSTSQPSVVEVREVDLDTFRALRESFDDRGVPVHDWILCDGENLRSMAITAGVDQRWPALDVNQRSRS